MASATVTVLQKVVCAALLAGFASGCWIGAHAQAGTFTASPPVSRDEGAALIVNGLSDRMRIAARGLAQGDRYAATTALNQARHLADAAAFARDVSPAIHAWFQAAHDAIERARHALQNGDAEASERVLVEAAARKRPIDVGTTPAPEGASERPADSAGKLAVNAQGESLGRLQAVERAADGAFLVQVSTGGILGIGAAVVDFRVPAILAGRHYVALATLARGDGTSADSRQAGGAAP